ncbi:MAG: hypothetical protein CME65_11400 [Halobacteriovoraceae bacterium]|nr:hypothetical protein [Halobacteriovoraceae bacterium]|tara:strand:- start:7194 stop:7916 length:723 start_codon:yes stop_codon:yes gene_type:complete
MLKNSDIKLKLLGKLQETIPPELQGSFDLFLLGSVSYNSHRQNLDNDSFILWNKKLKFEEKNQIIDAINQAFVQLGFSQCPDSMNVNNPLWQGTEKEWVVRVSELESSHEINSKLHLLALLDHYPIKGQTPDFIRSIKVDSSFLKLFCYDFVRLLGFRESFRKLILRVTVLVHYLNKGHKVKFNSINERLEMLSKHLNIDLSLLKNHSEISKFSFYKKIKVYIILVRIYLKFFILYLKED